MVITVAEHHRLDRRVDSAQRQRWQRDRTAQRHVSANESPAAAPAHPQATQPAAAETNDPYDLWSLPPDAIELDADALLDGDLLARWAAIAQDPGIGDIIESDDASELIEPDAAESPPAGARSTAAHHHFRRRYILLFALVGLLTIFLIISFRLGLNPWTTLPGVPPTTSGTSPHGAVPNTDGTQVLGTDDSPRERAGPQAPAYPAPAYPTPSLTGSVDANGPPECPMYAPSHAAHGRPPSQECFFVG